MLIACRKEAPAANHPEDILNVDPVSREAVVSIAMGDLHCWNTGRNPLNGQIQLFSASLFYASLQSTKLTGRKLPGVTLPKF
jgi:hypothetical protein